MNYERSLSNHQLYYLKEICLGHLILVEDEAAEKYYVFTDSKTYPGIHVMTSMNSKPRGGRHILCGGHLFSSVIELKQRGILELVGDRWMPNKEARRQFGEPPALVFPKRPVKMSRTRAARAQM